MGLVPSIPVDMKMFEVEVFATPSLAGVMMIKMTLRQRKRYMPSRRARYGIMDNNVKPSNRIQTHASLAGTDDKLRHEFVRQRIKVVAVKRSLFFAAAEI